MVKLVLLQLSLGIGGKPLSFAPHGWKSIMDMRLLGLEYESEWVTSGQLEKELPERFGLEKVTIPVSWTKPMHVIAIVSNVARD